MADEKLQEQRFQEICKGTEAAPLWYDRKWGHMSEDSLGDFCKPNSPKLQKALDSGMVGRGDG